MSDIVVGIVLAGGRSSRMGTDKALVRLGGRRLVTWTVERLAPQVDRLAISRHDGRLPDDDRGLPVLADGRDGHEGPLAGVLAGLDWAASLRPVVTHAITVPVDTPFLPADFVPRLLAARDATGAAMRSGAAVAASGGRRHPTAALWPVAARHALRAAMRDEALRRVGVFLERLAPAEARWAPDPDDPFLNLNTPEDLAAAEAIVQRRRDDTPAQVKRSGPC